MAIAWTPVGPWRAGDCVHGCLKGGSVFSWRVPCVASGPKGVQVKRERGGCAGGGGACSAGLGGGGCDAAPVVPFAEATFDRQDKGGS